MPVCGEDEKATTLSSVTVRYCPTREDKSGTDYRGALIKSLEPAAATSILEETDYHSTNQGECKDNALRISAGYATPVIITITIM